MEGSPACSAYLHLPMVAGVVLFAFALKKTLAHVGDDLDTVPAFALCGGPALYLLAYVALRFRIGRTLGGGRLVAAIACALLWPVAVVVPALIALTLMAADLGRTTRVRDHLVARGARADACTCAYGPHPEGEAALGRDQSAGPGGAHLILERLDVVGAVVTPAVDEEGGCA